MGYCTEMLLDSIIAIAMTRLLFSFRTGFRDTDSILQTFVMYSINTGVLTIIFVLLSLICYVVIPTSFAFLAFNFVFGKLYLNSLLGTLNARSRLRPYAQQTSPILTTGITASRGMFEECNASVNGSQSGHLRTLLHQLA
ncbi:hypothetical protein OBBRIDRAFT_793802 [Obba rivulosa]|uniref:DUF6534 domain-containing protein n=1 Tax=Obba rivulosa TaxID=1052685 RepID=A0A8E2DJ10_9APHY|nr:hypothetical protein OBBRIDRAFT_793802 [Obba rivulosa]